MALRPLQPADLFNFQAAGDAQLSPDGQWIAYLVQRSDYEKEKSYTDIYLASVAGQSSRRLTNTGNNTSPRFSPDGKRLAFSSSRSEKSQIWILDLDGGEAWQLPTEEEVGGFYWLPDSKQIAYTAKVFSKGEDWVPYPGAPDGDKERLIQLAKRNGKPDKKDDKKPNEIKVITRFRYRNDGIGYLGDVRRQVFVTPVPDSAPQSELKPAGKQITTGDFDHNDPTLSPDGRYMVVASRHTDTADYDHKVDLWLYDLANGQAHLLYDAPGPTGNPFWSPTGRLIAFTGHDNSVNVSTTSDLWLLDVSAFVKALVDGQQPSPLTSADAINVTRPLDRPVGAYAGSEIGLRGGNSMFWQDDELYFLLSDRGAAGIHKTTACGQVTPVMVDGDRCISSIHGRPDCLVYMATRPDQPDELYLRVGGEEHAIAHVNDKLLSEVALGKWEKIVYPSDDGQPVDGWIVYPVDYEAGKKYPLVLLVHGGPHAAYGPGFMFAAHMFAGAGYAVVYTNPRGSQTYGQKFACCIDKNWGDRDFADVMAGVDAVIAKGVADPDRMFVHGWSYGGYWTCWAVTQTNRFKAACAGASVSNMLSDYGTSDITWADEHEYGGQPWADAAHLLRHSPISHVRNVETPILLLHGEGDLRCPISQSEEFYTALKRLGKTAVMVRYPGEFHGPRRPLHRLDRYQRILAWFGHFGK